MPTNPTTTTAPEVAWDREEHEPCERGTVGCCIRHDGRRDDTCETW